MANCRMEGIPSQRSELRKTARIHGPPYARSLNAMNDLAGIALEMAFVLQGISKSPDVEDEPCLWRIWDRVAPLILQGAGSVSDDPILQALNTASGALAQVILDRLDLHQKAQPPNLPPGIWDRLTLIADPNSEGALPAKVLVAARLARLFQTQPGLDPIAFPAPP